MNATAKTTPASPGKSTKAAPVEKTVDMSDFDPTAAQRAHRHSIAADCGDDVLHEIETGEAPTE